MQKQGASCFCILEKRARFLKTRELPFEKRVRKINQKWLKSGRKVPS